MSKGLNGKKLFDYTINSVPNRVICKYKKTNIYKIIRSVKTGENIHRRCNSGAKVKIDDNVLRQVQSLVNDGFSIRSAAKQLRINQSTVVKALKRAGFVIRKKSKRPQVSERQQEVQMYRAQRLVHELKERSLTWIMDDETYIEVVKGKRIQTYIYKKGDPILDVSMRSLEVSKFPMKILIWIAISPFGCSEPFIKSNKNFSVNSETYKSIIDSHLYSFWLQQKNRYKDKTFKFWPDLATSHYSSVVQNHLKSLDIDCVDKESNPPNLPECRPVEKFWAHIKQLIYCNGWDGFRIAKSSGRSVQDVYIDRIREVINKKRELTRSNALYFQNLFKNVNIKLNAVAMVGRDALAELTTQEMKEMYH